MQDTNFKFDQPKNCPVFNPTSQEWRDPLEYIAKIKPIGEKAGICKIIPPKDWNPPFAVDLQTFRFTPRIQKLNELEAKSRVKLFFLESLAKFWDLQGQTVRVPNVERKMLDLFQLRKIVQDEGGYEVICKERKWMKVAQILGYPQGKHVGSTLRGHYERIIYPYDVFKSGANVDMQKIQAHVENLKSETYDADKSKDIKPKIDDGKANGSKNGEDRRNSKEEDKVDFNRCSELKKLQFFGAGPKMAVADQKVVAKKEESPAKDRVKTRDKGRMTYIDHYMCELCGRGDDEPHMLLCDGCDDAFHTHCLYPPLLDIPKGDWRCPECVSKVCNKPQGPYGFFQAAKEYTLFEFGEKCDSFKSEYFGQSANAVACEEVEREYWRLVNSLDDDVQVEYGADIHAMEMGSGFPTEERSSHAPEKYKNCKWNLNNLSVLPHSLLKHIPGNISGMKIPWCYVGMCFSSFAWHTEDHWSYSINYLHWGEPKTWYGVPGDKAEMLEDCMKQYAPELFEQSPDLLHQLTTIMNPNTLMLYGVPIVRSDQNAGEFMVTFPRAYHAGFNQGFNFAEAVNFTPVDWLKKGRECVSNYRQIGRQCVFSHDELVLSVARNCDDLDLIIIEGILADLETMYKDETALRAKVTYMGFENHEKVTFSTKSDDERICVLCKTTLYLSGLACKKCSIGKEEVEYYCLFHANSMCSCDPSKYKVLCEGLDMEEVPKLIKKLKSKTELVSEWSQVISKVLTDEDKVKRTYDELVDLKEEAIKKSYSKCPEFKKLSRLLSDAEKCETVAVQLSTAKIRTRQRNADSSTGQLNVVSVPRVTFKELVSFVEKIDSLPCTISHGMSMKGLLKKVKDFIEEMDSALLRKREGSDIVFYEQLLEKGINLNVEIPKLHKLKHAVLQSRWLADIDKLLDGVESRSVHLNDVKKYMEKYVSLPGEDISCQHAMSSLQELLNGAESIEERAEKLLTKESRASIEEYENLAQEAKDCPAILDKMSIVEDVVDKYIIWKETADELEDSRPFVESIESVISKGKSLPVHLEQFAKFEAYLNSANFWLESCEKSFVKQKNNGFSLIDILLPRSVYLQEHIASITTNKKKGASVFKMENTFDDGRIQREISELERKEIQYVYELRKANQLKAKQVASKVNNDDVKICICKKKAWGVLIQCALCCQLYHTGCTQLPKQVSLVLKSKNAADMPTSSQASAAVQDLMWLCNICSRSKRPHLEEVTNLVHNLKNVSGVRIKEGEALKRLCERGSNWKNNSKMALRSPEFQRALNTPQKLVPNESVRRMSGATASVEHDYSVAALNKSLLDLTEEKKNLIEKLVIEGNLLELTVYELKDLWKLYEMIAKKEGNFLKVLVINSVGAAKPKKRLSTDKEKPVKQKKARKSFVGLKEKTKEECPSGEEDDEDDDEDEDEICAAKPCRKPSSDKVSWVLCDKCNNWFHYYCVGKKDHEISETEDFNCGSCTKKKPRNSVGKSGPVPYTKTPVSLLKQRSTTERKSSSEEDIDFVAVAARKRNMEGVKTD